MHSTGVYIAAVDMVSPLGTDFESQLEQAGRGQSGIGRLTRFRPQANFPVHIAGQVPEFDTSPYPFLSARKLAHWTSPVFRHALLVCQRALEKCGLAITPDLAPRVGVTFSSAIGGLDALLAADRKLVSKGSLPHPFTNPNSCINMVAGKIAILTGATGPITTSVAACATGSTSVVTGAMFLLQGMADVVICGAVDFPLVEPIVAGFATMNGAYKTQDASRASLASRPFSEHRKGFVISEGAACIILATADFLNHHGIEPLCQLVGWSLTSDAHHFVAPYRPTVARCMGQAIQHAGIHANEIDSVNAHATSTQLGDRVEAQALRDVFGPVIPPISANKSFLGHCMGAASAVECVLTIYGLVSNQLYPTINYLPDPELGLPDLLATKRALPQRFVLKNSFGFGGCNACLVFAELS